MKRELVMLANGKEVARVEIDENTVIVLNDRSTFAGASGCSVWTSKAQNLETEDLEQIFLGNDEHPMVKQMLEI